MFSTRVEVGKTTPQERISERSQFIEVPKTLCWESAEVMRSIPQERISEGMGKQSRDIEVPKISRQGSAEEERVSERMGKQNRVVLEADKFQCVVVFLSV